MHSAIVIEVPDAVVGRSQGVRSPIFIVAESCRAPDIDVSVVGRDRRVPF